MQVIASQPFCSCKNGVHPSNRSLPIVHSHSVTLQWRASLITIICHFAPRSSVVSKFRILMCIIWYIHSLCVPNCEALFKPHCYGKNVNLCFCRRTWRYPPEYTRSWQTSFSGIPIFKLVRTAVDVLKPMFNAIYTIRGRFRGWRVSSNLDSRFWMEHNACFDRIERLHL